MQRRSGRSKRVRDEPDGRFESASGSDILSIHLLKKKTSTAQLNSARSHFNSFLQSSSFREKIDDLDNVTIDHLQGGEGVQLMGKFMNWLIQEQNLKSSTLKAYLSAIRTYFLEKFAAESGQIQSLLGDFFSSCLSKTTKLNCERRQQLGLPLTSNAPPSSFEEARQIVLSALRFEKIESATLLGLQAVKGGRASDICADTINSQSPALDRASGLIYVKFWRKKTSTYTSALPMAYNINDWVLDPLHMYYRHLCVCGPLKSKSETESFLFPKAASTEKHSQYLNRILQDLIKGMKDSGININPDITSHSFRSTMFLEALNHPSISRHTNALYHGWQNQDPQQTGAQRNYDVKWDLFELHKMARVPLKSRTVETGGSCPRLAPRGSLPADDPENKAYELVSFLFHSNADRLNPGFAECITAAAIIAFDDMATELGESHILVTRFLRALSESAISAEEFYIIKQRLLSRTILNQFESVSEKKLSEFGIRIPSTMGRSLAQLQQQTDSTVQILLAEILQLRSEVKLLNDKILDRERRRQEQDHAEMKQQMLAELDRVRNAIQAQMQKFEIQSELGSQRRHQELMDVLRCSFPQSSDSNVHGRNSQSSKTQHLNLFERVNLGFSQNSGGAPISVDDATLTIDRSGEIQHTEQILIQFPERFLSLEGHNICDLITAWFDKDSGVRDGMFIRQSEKGKRARSNIKSITRFVCRFLPHTTISSLPENIRERTAWRSRVERIVHEGLNTAISWLESRETVNPARKKKKDLSRPWTFLKAVQQVNDFPQCVGFQDDTTTISEKRITV